MDESGPDGPSSKAFKAQLQHTLIGHRWTVSCLSFHPAARMLASGSFDRTIRIWDTNDGKLLKKLDRAQHTQPITSIQWHPNGALLATTSADNTTCLWDASSGQKMRTLREHFGWVLDCSFAPDRTKLATCSWDKTVRLWDPNTGELISTLRGHTKGIWACAFYPIGHTSALLASGGEDCTARLWDTRSRKVALTLSGGHADAIYSIAWSNSGTHIVTGSSDKAVTVWDPKAGKILRILKGHTDTVKNVAFSPSTQDNDVEVMCSAGGYSACIWNPLSPRDNLVEEVQQHVEGKEVECVSISGDGTLMATGSRDGMINISTVPYVRKVARATDVVKSTPAQNWRSKEKAIEKEKGEWQDAVRRRKEKMLQVQKDREGEVRPVNLMKKPTGPGSRRPKDEPAQQKRWSRAADRKDDTEPEWKKRQRESRVPPPEPVNRAKEHPQHPMVKGKQTQGETEAPVPKRKQIGDLNQFMAGLKTKTDTRAEAVKEIKKSDIVVRKPTADLTLQQSMDSLMSKPVVGKKVRLRKLSVEEPEDLNKDEKDDFDDAFANY